MSAIPPAYHALLDDNKSASSPSSSSINGGLPHSLSLPPITSFSHSSAVSGELDSLSYSTPHGVIQPWDMSEPGGRTTYLPGPQHEDDSTDPFAAARLDVESDGLLETPNVHDDYAVQQSHPTTGSDSAASDGGGMVAGEEEGNNGDGSPSDKESVPSYVPPAAAVAHKKLSQWFATAICGNDITSSCFYVTGICVGAAGVYAPLCMLLVACTLYLFRSIYGESVTALPLNGGAYNVLLNTTSKSTAAMAACLTILSYMATAVVSAASAIDYLQSIWPGVNVTMAVLLLLAFFALLCLWGISESADVALVIFTLHMLTLFTLAAVTVIWLITHGAPELSNNLLSPLNPPFSQAMFYGFASAMLGVSGFESSANFVEEQAEGVFILTLRNMWAAVAFFNPVIATLSVSVFSIDVLARNPNTVLALLGQQCGGAALRYWVCIDAFLVLAGSVLTAFVGVNGLCRRLALDRCLPQLLLAENKWRRTNHVIILGFLFICSSIYLLLAGAIDALASVYAVSFLSVMSLFAIGNMSVGTSHTTSAQQLPPLLCSSLTSCRVLCVVLCVVRLLKYKRGFLPRSVRASWPTVFIALVLVFIALAGVLARDTSVLLIWFAYLVAVGSFLAVMFFRVQTLKMVYHALHGINATLGFHDGPLLDAIAASIKSISSQAVGFFVKGGQLAVLNKAVLYVRQNEDCAHIRIIHVYDVESRIPRRLRRNVALLDEAYPKVKIDLILVKGQFGPHMINYLSQQLNIPRNLFFITSPKEDFSHKLESLGGVRLITH